MPRWESAERNKRPILLRRVYHLINIPQKQATQLYFDSLVEPRLLIQLLCSVVVAAIPKTTKTSQLTAQREQGYLLVLNLLMAAQEVIDALAGMSLGGDIALPAPSDATASSTSPPTLPTSVKIYVSTKGLDNKIGELEKVIICTFLGPVDLLSLSVTSKSFWLAARVAGDVWLDFTLALWATRRFNSPHMKAESESESDHTTHATTITNTSPLSKPNPPTHKPTSHVNTLSSRIKALPISALVRLLHRVDTSFCREKHEYQALVRSFITFGLRRDHTPAGMKIRYPPWSLTLDERKATYFHARREILRDTITASELCAVTWYFHFKHNDVPNDDDGSRGNGVKAEFREDYTMTSAIHANIMEWQWQEGRDRSGRPNRTMIQVEQYPPLTITVLESGAWRLENDHVFFEQRETLGPEQVRLC